MGALPTLQGASLVPYALGELIDNSLRATSKNAGARKITITLATSGGSSTSSGLLSVWDNGGTCLEFICEEVLSLHLVFGCGRTPVWLYV
jgi:hypothetical protein